MTLYRVTYRKEGGASDGYTWHSSRREALALAARAARDNPQEYGTEPASERVEPIELTPTKAGILQLLSTYATYADNG